MEKRKLDLRDNRKNDSLFPAIGPTPGSPPSGGQFFSSPASHKLIS